ncbi:Rrf2 family transcriptional regulator [Paenibacillus sp. NEAU-GSW1]|uniref:Rrf2 family transcriptional regulator n=1 Tax=Paenibacillus sp. NEAU-GSW1 TaxID=2682486 RepID=UPI0012E2EE94|nr:Rrf2 family transcriptional regulator [Paenibacillus sp. NEAU-GSW1]MUT67192.1 Rrf2 family transcriptional regulator [Paenibacillus sp. NEAU-GSW1]
MNSRSIQVGPAKFGIAVHALIWLAQSGGFLTSASIAGQVNSHATFLRRVLALLSQSGIVEAREGRDGGYCLKKAADKLTLADIYVAVKSDECSGESADGGNCGGEAIMLLDQALNAIMAMAEQQTIDLLATYTLSDLMSKVSLCPSGQIGNGDMKCPS